ncbi:hypothetical protein ANOM_009421 [Aspergillus nomiae NRRL 13137]|uniref:C2H2-type domain-containing protein n=1 Tax=Aspergillus nomiae NRRL (strain ATCC 15546 / NRRL 13137 / CBS 260.88 / M93) TaxID=1509407 RepID=A0A0L1ISD9_ASPN3|nr:uncharacterized protein ANOM_009421 [Aspergillus nomiae NRRL 13137]KNG82404.1 hypothetical protein ANOM_009421 [Aspergillus nomiae NRRL 13137]
MDVPDDNHHLIYDLPVQCEDLFDKVVRNAALQPVLLDFQTRFRAWTVGLKVFARPNQCLDWRLRQRLDIRDVIVQTLTILQRDLVNLRQSDTVDRNATRPTETEPTENQFRTKSIDTAALKAVNGSLDELYRLEAGIRDSTFGRLTPRFPTFVGDPHLESFMGLASLCIRTLYPNAHQRLQRHLSESMTERYAAMKNTKPRQQAFQTPRDKNSSPMLTIDDEQQCSKARPPPIQDEIEGHHSISNEDGEQRALQRGVKAISLSNLSSTNTGQLKPMLSGSLSHSQPDQAWSIHLRLVEYPSPPERDGTNIVACDWCSEPLDEKTLDGRNWQNHVDRDLKPYLCIFEECYERYPSFATFNDWQNHMISHSRRWHREIYKKPSWICAVCDCHNDVFSSSEAFSSHSKELHCPEFTAAQLESLSWLSETSLPRPCDVCLLCGYRVVENSSQTQRIKPFLHRCAKRTREPSRGTSNKSARITYDSHHAMPHCSIDISSSSSSEDEDSEHLTVPAHTEVGDMVAQHVAAHFQALMLLTIRLASIQVEDEDMPGEIRSDICDIDGSERSISGRLSVEMSGVSTAHLIDGDACTDSGPSREGATTP